MPDQFVSLNEFLECGYQRAKLLGENNTGPHLDTLRRYAAEGQHATEFGVASMVTTWAFLLACPAVVSYDVYPTERARLAWDWLQGSGRWEFRKGSTLEIEIAPTDLLFIDTWHTYKQLSAELARHAAKVRRYIALHDTDLFGAAGEDGSEPGLMRAVEELVAGGRWKIVYHTPRACGLTVLERTEPCATT